MIQRRIEPFRALFEAWWVRQPEATRSLPSYASRALANYWRYGARQAAALSYYAIFSLFPLVLLFSILFSRLVGPVLAQQQVSYALASFLPSATTDAFQFLETNITQAFEQSGSFTLIALAGLIWSGLGLFSNITSALDFIFQVPKGRSLWRQRLVASAMALAFLVLLIMSFLTSAVMGLVSAVLFNSPGLWVSIGTFFLPIGLDMVIFALLFRFVPARRVHWDAVWPAAIFGAVGWELAKSIFGWYLTNVASSNYQFVYGTLATGIILLFWAYLVASIFLLSAELCAALNDWHIDRHRNEDEIRFLEGKAVAQVKELAPAISPQIPAPSNQ